jgi:RNA polymerase sigma factor (sigma-70 family)
MASALSNGLRRVTARFAADPTPDGDLLSRFLTSRDEAAFAELVRRHGRMVFATCRRVLGNAADADDAFQAAFVVLVRKGHALTGRACVGDFLYATAVLTARKARTMATRRRSNEAKAGRPESVAQPGIDDETTRVLDEELAGLPEKYRGPVVLCELEGVSRKEAATRRGIPAGTISSRLATAHRMLAKRLAARGFAPVAVAAVLGNQAVAVPHRLAAAAVRAVADVPPAEVTQLVAEVTKMLLWNKLKAGAAVLTGVLLLLGVGLLPTGGPQATAAPVPKAAAADGGLIWTYHYTTGELTAYTPEGEKAKALKLKDGRQLRGITPDGSKLVFVGRNGRLADATDQKAGRTIHLRDVGEGTEGVDTGIAYHSLDQFHWSPDGRQVVRVSPERGRWTKFVNTLIDLDTKKETPLRLPHDPEQVAAWSPDGKWLLTTHYAGTVKKGDVSYHLTEHHRFDLEKGTSEPLGEKGQLYNLVVSPDGRSLFGQAIESRESVAAGLKDLVMVRTDVGTGESAEVARHEDQSFASARWSPGGKRVAYLWHKRADMSEAFLSVIDPDGKNPKSVTIPTPGNTANEFAILGWFPDTPAAKPPAAERKEEPKKEAKKADEPKWKAEFIKAYGLNDGELVKRVAPPYPDCRTEYFRAVLERQQKKPPTDAELEFAVNNFTVFNWKDGTPSAGWQTHATPDEGVSLQFVLGTVLELHTTRIRDDATALNRKITGDFVVRTGADREKLSAQLEVILWKELELPVKFTFADEEEDVFVLSGKYEAKPLEGRKAEQVEVYSAHLTARNVGGGGGGTFAAMAEAVERHVNRPIVLENVEGVPARVFWHFNCRDLNDRIKKAQDTHPPTVLDNLAAQTGLTAKEERRKVRKLVIEDAELKK